ncbi:hypothetical protein [Rubrivirga marina]|uniref:Uncharacterized protein n=1 Tax=Rubrivirga marina TaxID=1196024 RepID=A0A271J4Y1_9BACT|nr:hypothetical protein [Rubrivirga marina]PAP78015.1 hypothetical protein BSZ37_16990 [Rubrivirga marina]
MPRPDPTPDAARRPLDALPDGQREELEASADADRRKRDLADLGGTLQRRARERGRIGLPGGAECPPFLQAAEAEAPGAARLYVVLDGERFDVERAVDVGTYLELDETNARAALQALRRAELVIGPDDDLVTVSPGDVPF